MLVQYTIPWISVAARGLSIWAAPALHLTTPVNSQSDLAHLMVVKLDAPLQGVIQDVAKRLRVGSVIQLQPADASIVSATDVDGRIVGHLDVQQLQELPFTVQGGEVRSLRKQAGVISEVLVRFTDSPAQPAVAAGACSAGNLRVCASRWQTHRSACGMACLGQGSDVTDIAASLCQLASIACSPALFS